MVLLLFIYRMQWSTIESTKTKILPLVNYKFKITSNVISIYIYDYCGYFDIHFSLRAWLEIVLVTATIVSKNVNV